MTFAGVGRRRVAYRRRWRHGRRRCNGSRQRVRHKGGRRPSGGNLVVAQRARLAQVRVEFRMAVVEGGEAAAVAAAAIRLVGGGGRTPRRSGRLGVDLYRAVAAQAALLVSLGAGQTDREKENAFWDCFPALFFSLTLSYSSKINSYLYHKRVSPLLKKNALICYQRAMLPIHSGVTALCRK